MSAYDISILSAIGINVILAVSLNMISGFCGQISLGHGAFYGAGAYAASDFSHGYGMAFSLATWSRWRRWRSLQGRGLGVQVPRLHPPVNAGRN